MISVSCLWKLCGMGFANQQRVAELKANSALDSKSQVRKIEESIAGLSYLFSAGCPIGLEVLGRWCARHPAE